MNRIYEKLRNDEKFKDKMNFDESINHLTIAFHDYLSLVYIEGNYTSCCDEGIIYLTGSKYAGTHWHITEDEEALEAITDFFNETDVYIENTNIFTFSPLKVMTSKRFEKEKEKYMTRKSLRIYTATEIIKRSAK